MTGASLSVLAETLSRVVEKRELKELAVVTCLLE